MRWNWGYILLLIAGMVTGSCSDKGNKKPVNNDQPRKIEVLFLGHDSEHHNSAAYAPILASALAVDGINFTYTEDPDALNKENLAKYDVLILYANHDSLTNSKEHAIMDFLYFAHV